MEQNRCVSLSHSSAVATPSLPAPCPVHATHADALRRTPSRRQTDEQSDRNDMNRAPSGSSLSAQRTLVSAPEPAPLRLPMMLLLLLLLLVVGPGSLLLPSSAAPAAPSVRASVSTVYLDVFQQSLLAYQLQVPSFTGVTLESHSGAKGIDDAITGAFDFVVASNSIPTVLATAQPTLDNYPFPTAAIAPAYNLPADAVGSATLSLTNNAMCRIWRGNITHWNDTAITATNPLLRLPFERITVLQLDFANDASRAASRLCTKVDPGWAASIGVSNHPRLSHVVGITAAQGSSALAAYILEHPYAIGFTAPNEVDTQMAELVNQANKSVAASPATVAQAFLELSAHGVLPGGGGFDLSNAQSAYAWPANMGGWIFIDKDKVLSTCATKAEVLKFILWMYESPVVQSLAEAANLAMPPALYLKQSGLLERMRKEILCDGSSLLTADSTSASIRGNAMVTAGVNLMTQLYAQVDSTYSYSFKPMSDALALDRIAVGEIDFAVVSNAALTAEQKARFMASSINEETGAVEKGGLLLPALLTGAVPTFSLPTAITELYATRSDADDLGLPNLYPLQIDMDALARVFLGNISSWMDPEMRKINPRLKAWFDRTGAPTELKPVVCCTNDADPFVAGSIVADHLLRTKTMQTALGPAATAAAKANPRTLWSLLKQLHASASSLSFVDRESTLNAKLNLQAGSVSYRMLNSAKAHIASDFQLAVVNSKGKGESISATSDSLLKCLAPIMGSQVLVTEFLAGGGNFNTSFPGCWPLQGLASLAVASTFSSKNQPATIGAVVQAKGDAAASHQSTCVRAQKNLELLRWMQLNSVLSGALYNSGIVRISEFENFRNYLVDQRLNSATCDGKTILITLPIIWEVPGAATGFAIAMACLIILACAVTILGLYRYRHHPMIRSASPIFLAQVAAGLALLAGSLVAWASPVTDSSCLAFQWLVDLGFTLAFAPLFAKTWRIYQIFSAKKIKVVKISNGRLVWVVLAMLAFELVVLSVWTGVSPLQPVLYEQSTNQLDGAIRQLAHCAVEGAAGSAFLALEASFKGALLLFGCLMGFSTRRVAASFNESSTIAWAIYNVVFTSLVVGAILLFLDTLGDTLIWIVLILFLWIAVGTWLLIFVPKASAVLGGEEKFQINANSTSLGSLSKHDGSITFASITGMGRAQLLVYRTALENQLEKIKKALGLTQVRSDSEGRILHAHSELAEPSVRAIAHGMAGGRAWFKQPRPTPPASDEPEDANRANPGAPAAIAVPAAPAPTTSSSVRQSSPSPARSPPMSNGLHSRKTSGGLAASWNLSGAASAHQRSGSAQQHAELLSTHAAAALVQSRRTPEGNGGGPTLAASATGSVDAMAPPASASASASASPSPCWEAHTAPGLRPSTAPGILEDSKPVAEAATAAMVGSSSQTRMLQLAVDPSVPAAATGADPEPASPMRLAVSLAPKPSSRAQAIPIAGHSAHALSSV